MDLTKQELIEKLTKVNQFIVGLEDLDAEKINLETDVVNSENDLERIKHELMQWIIGFFVSGILAGLFCFIYYHTSWKIMRIGAIIGGAIALLYVSLSISHRKDIKTIKKEIIVRQNEFNGMDKKFETFFSQNEQEINDANVFFPGDYYPLSRHIQYGLNCLTSGRADDFKEFMNLIDELIHREKLESEAEAQTENTRQAAANSRAALNAARVAANEARRAANTSHTVYINRY
jgi:uncharacterized membrane-anchored protein YhcB (DUF1043 family)